MKFDELVKRVRDRSPECCLIRNGEVDLDFIILTTVTELGKRVDTDGAIRNRRKLRR